MTNVLEVVEASYANDANVSCSQCGEVIETKGECVIHFDLEMTRISHDECFVDLLERKEMEPGGMW